MSYPATALSEYFSGGRISGQIRLHHGQLEFVSSIGDVFKYSLSDIIISRGGSADRYIYLKPKSDNNITFYTDDLSLLKNAEMMGRKDLYELSRKINSRFYLSVSAIVAVVVLFVGLGVWVVFKSNFIIKKISDMVPYSVENSLSQTMKEQALSTNKVLKDSLLYAELAKIYTPLIEAAADTNFHFSFTVIENSEINAFALPGGPVIIHAGLLQKAENTDEIAGVLAHEISHITLRHHLRGLIGNIGLFTLFRAAVGDITGLSASIINTGAALGSLTYSRGFETESDESGLKLLQKAGLNEQGLITFFTKLQKEQQLPETAEFLSTHPVPENRIKHLKKLIDNSSKGSHVNASLALIQKQIKKELTK